MRVDELVAGSQRPLKGALTPSDGRRQLARAHQSRPGQGGLWTADGEEGCGRGLRGFAGLRGGAQITLHACAMTRVVPPA